MRKIALSAEGWSHCLTIVSLCSNIIVDIPSIVPLHKNKRNYGSHCATHALAISTRDTASDLTLFCKVYESKRAFHLLPQTLEKKNKKAKESGAYNIRCSPTNSRLNIFLRFYGLSIRRHAENVGTLYGFARPTRIDRGKLILRR